MIKLISALIAYDVIKFIAVGILRVIVKKLSGVEWMKKQVQKDIDFLKNNVDIDGIKI